MTSTSSSNLPLDGTRLAPVGVAFLEVVRARWPQLLPYATVDAHGSLVIAFPSPHRADAEPLRVVADAHDEIVVAFGGGWEKSGSWRVATAADPGFAASQRLLDDLFTERAVACTFRDGRRALGSLDELRATDWWRDLRTLRSWRGTHDWNAVERTFAMYWPALPAGVVCLVALAGCGWSVWLVLVTLLAGVFGYARPALGWRAGAALLLVQPLFGLVFDVASGAPARSTGGFAGACIGSFLMALVSPLPLLAAQFAAWRRARLDARHCPPPWARLGG